MELYMRQQDQALKVAMDVIRDFLFENEMQVYLVIFDKAAYHISETLFADIAEYIDDNYVDEHTDCRRESMGMNMPMQASIGMFEADLCECKDIMLEEDLDAKLKQIDESFSQMLLRKIDEKGMTDAECYKKANIDKKTFSKIKCNPDTYRPSKQTAVAFAIALKLDLDETQELLASAGLTLSKSFENSSLEYILPSMHMAIT